MKIYKTAVISTFSILLIAAIWLGLPPEESYIPAYALASKVVVIDPGHGGCDPGASRGAYVEKDITLAISQHLARQLSEAGAMVVMLRTEDRDLVGDGFSGTVAARKREDLKLRAQRANEVKADLYISIHTNADPSPRWYGAQVFYDASSKPSKLTAVMIQEEITKQLGNTKRKAAPGDYYILRNTQMPAVIVEVGFISNPQEASLLADNDYQVKMAQAIFAGIAQAQVRTYDTEIELYPNW
ncbi:MAG TPA: N-acetylmuramoyl-L-alanine amidase CwlD [Syntrophomonas sp.]|jgi:N-acetylmuramoyl-L-alanine amidase|nr:N-acetylmuramoyl-L-alanine amidase CwlD [Syntrophomonas sp.]